VQGRRVFKNAHPREQCHHGLLGAGDERCLRCGQRHCIIMLTLFPGSSVPTPEFHSIAKESFKPAFECLALGLVEKQWGQKTDYLHYLPLYSQS